MALCHHCSNVVRFAKDSLNRIHSTCQSFLKAVDEGCYICCALFCQLPEVWKKELRSRFQVSEPPATKERKPNEELRLLTWYKNVDMVNSTSGLIRLNIGMANIDACAPSHKMDRPDTPHLFLHPMRNSDKTQRALEGFPWSVASKSTNSDETFSKITSWIDTCDETHTKCRARRDEADMAWHPTRLIEIVSEPQICDKAEKMTCRIVELDSGNIPHNLRYITLSHRWPQNQQGFQKLTADLLPQWKSSLPIEGLHQTFRDALLVARKLGITYVWIDSLCIVQDDDNFADWKRESPMMQKVYSNAEFNICASKNVGSEYGAGLFSSREPANFQHLYIELSDDEDPGNTVDVHLSDRQGRSLLHRLRGFRQKASHLFFRRHGHVPGIDVVDTSIFRGSVNSGKYLITKSSPIAVWNERMHDSPLAFRGWVFQEQLLSRANLHFNGHEVLFECLEMRASESLGSDQHYAVSWQPRHDFLKEHLPIFSSMQEESLAPDENIYSDHDYDRFEGHLYKRWHQLLNQYTTRQLTKFDDRLVALSGVAQYFKKFFSQNNLYIAGLWHNRLAMELLWQISDGKPREEWVQRKQARRHLSFSWTSVEGEIENEVGTRFPGSVKIMADQELVQYRKSPAPMQTTVLEELPFAEDIFSLPSKPTVEVKLTGFLRPMTLNIPSVVRDYGDLDLYLDLHIGNHQIEGRTRLDFSIGVSELTDLNDSGRLFLMPIVQKEFESIWFLLLELVEPKDGVNMGRFRRIGVHYIVHHRRSVDGLFEECLSSEGSFRQMAVSDLLMAIDEWVPPMRSGIDLDALVLPWPLDPYTFISSPYEDLSELPCWWYDVKSKRHTIFII